jgi:Yip1 domain
MSVTVDPQAVPSPLPDMPSMSLVERLVAIFARPSQAWGGLREQGQWWFPMLVSVAILTLTTAFTYDRAFLPMMTEQFQQQVAEGQIAPEKADEMMTFFAGSAGKAINIGVQVIVVPVMALIMAVGIWVAGGFILGTKLSYRQSLDVATWSGLVAAPSFVLTGVIAWVRSVSLRDVHLGLAILLPQSDTPSKLMTGVAAFLDWLGPFPIWSLVVAILGTAAISGAPKKSVAWVLSGLYLVVIIFLSAILGAMTKLAPGS